VSGKGNSNVAPVYSRSGGVAPLIFNICARISCQYQAPDAVLQWKDPGIHWIGGSVRPEPVWTFRRGKNFRPPTENQTLGCPDRSLVTTQSELSRLWFKWKPHRKWCHLCSLKLQFLFSHFQHVWVAIYRVKSFGTLKSSTSKNVLCRRW